MQYIKKHVTIILFVIGLLLELAALLGAQAANIPFVLKTIAPKYAHVQSGIQTLDTTNELLPQTEGFAEISELFLNRLTEEHNLQNVDKIEFLKIYKGPAYLGFGANHAREVIPVTALLSSKQTILWNMAELMDDAENFKNINLFHYTLLIFGLGAFIQCVAFYIRSKESL